MQLLEATAVGRDINRHRYLTDELDEALQSPLVRQLMGLIRLRNTHPAFAGEWRLADGDDEVVEMRWEHDGDDATLRVELGARTFALSVSTPDGTATATEREHLETLGR